MTKSKLVFYVKLATCLMTALLLLLVVIVIWQSATLGRLNSQSAALDKQIEQNSITKAELEAGIELRSDEAYLEQQARENLGMIEQNGETIYVVS